MITKKEVLSNIFRLIRIRYGVQRKITQDQTFADLKFDNYDVLYIAMACDELFGINISVEEMATMVDVKSVISLVCSKLKTLGKLASPIKKKKAPKEEMLEEPPKEIIVDNPEESIEEIADKAQQELGLTDEQKQELVDKAHDLEDKLAPEENNQ